MWVYSCEVTPLKTDGSRWSYQAARTLLVRVPRRITDCNPAGGLCETCENPWFFKGSSTGETCMVLPCFTRKNCGKNWDEMDLTWFDMEYHSKSGIRLKKKLVKRDQVSTWSGSKATPIMAIVALRCQVPCVSKVRCFHLRESGVGKCPMTWEYKGHHLKK